MLTGLSRGLALVSMMAALPTCGGAAGDPCAQSAGACVVLSVRADDIAVDTLDFALSGVVSHRFQRDVAGLPVRVPIELVPEASGTLVVSALGLRGGDAVALGRVETAVSAETRGELEIVLAAAHAACDDSFKDGNETDVDCGGPRCTPCGESRACTVQTDCASGLLCNAASVCESVGPTAPFTFQAVTPASGPTSGGATVTLKGLQFPQLAGYSVSFGGTATTSVLWRSATELTVQLPARLGQAGQVDVTITDPLQRAVTLPKGFRYDVSVVDFPLKATVNVTSTDGVKVVTNALSAGTLNGDAAPDLVLLSRDESKVYVFQNKGDGTFDRKADVTSIGGRPFDGVSAIALGDASGN